MKNKEKNLYEPLDKKSYKKKYLVRKHEEKEREQEIKEFDPRPDPDAEYPQTQEERPTKLL